MLTHITTITHLQRKVANRYYYGDFSKMTIEGDLLAMIEVAEHIEDEKLIPFSDKRKVQLLSFQQHTSR
jgi:hypothetical protein